MKKKSPTRANIGGDVGPLCGTSINLNTPYSVTLVTGVLQNGRGAKWKSRSMEDTNIARYGSNSCLEKISSPKLNTALLMLLLWPRHDDIAVLECRHTLHGVLRSFAAICSAAVSPQAGQMCSIPFPPPHLTAIQSFPFSAATSQHTTDCAPVVLPGRKTVAGDSPLYHSQHALTRPLITTH